MALQTTSVGAVPVHRSLRRVRARRMRPAHAGIAWLFVLPFVVIFAVFTAVPAATAVVLTMTDIGVADLRDPFGVNFVFLENFQTVLTAPDFLRSALNTVIYVGIGVPATMAIGFLLALALDSGIRRARSVFRAIIYVPVIANIVAAAVVWQYAFTLNGPINSFLADLGIVGPNWLGTPTTALFVVLLLTIWRTTGTCMVLFLAGLQSIPEEVHEAASLDGAGYWRRVFQMTLPLLRPTTLLVTVLMSVMYLNIFEEPFLVTDGGPLGSTKSVALWVYEQFGFGNMSNAMTGSIVLLLGVLVICVIQFRMLRPKQ
ncbi:carbohydrate ABC transporter permease [Agromyces sp. Soil535]|uniref:carbohydrate ABC transporter permease n=1 Tax=Agromyces sp. Soil535 TaxID=1736390 RepID=UPI0006F9AD70|nr:sugar ABC transporter permease [Agromyces sp. Soil535]KRE28927.1 sugar ABC transporter permease [Agromyces sp. Soil535]